MAIQNNIRPRRDNAINNSRPRRNNKL